MPAKKPTVHIVEFSDISDHELKAALAADGFQVVSYHFDQAISALPADEHPDLVLVSLIGGQGGGVACCRNFRSAFPECAICLVHEDLSEWEESIALELGADAVVRRPSEARRIMAQVRSLLRRPGRHQFPRLQLLPGSRTVEIDSQSISLTDAEFDLLSVLAEQRGTVVSRDTLSLHLRGLAYDDRDRTIDLRIARIRQKLGDNAHRPVFIRTVRGEGYMLITDDP